VRRMPLTGLIPVAVVAALSLLTNPAAADWENPADRYADAYRQFLDASCPLADGDVRHFMYVARDRGRLRGHAMLDEPRIAGAQVMYLWSALEPARDQYDFSAIEADLEFLQAHGKALFVQLQDATFFNLYQPAPAYLLSGEFDGGAVPQYNDDGDPEGWTVKRWNPAVQERFGKLLDALGRQFDGRIEGINLQESAIGVTAEQDPTFSPPAYAQALRHRMRALKSAFPRSVTMQYANFMPGEWLPWEDEGYLRGLYRYGDEIGVGLGGPDLMVRRRGQLNHTIAMMHEHDYSVPLGIAVQDGNYIGQTGADGAIADEIRRERRNLVPMLYEFARDFLRVDYLFWVDQAPYFEEDVLPCLRPPAASSPTTGH